MGISTILKGFLYLGAARDTKNSEEMKKLKISHIVSCAGNVKNYSQYEVLRANNLEDVPDQDILTFIDTSFEFIEEARCKGGVVFVHCLAGKSRSPTIIIAYLMMVQRQPLKDIYKYVVSARDIVQPNDGFMTQLLQLEFKTLGSQSFAVNEWKTLKPNNKKSRKQQYLQQEPYASEEGSSQQQGEQKQNNEKDINDISEGLQSILTLQRQYRSTMNKELDNKIQEYLKNNLTATIILKAIGEVPNLYASLQTNVSSGKSVSTLFGTIKKHVGKEFFTLTSGGEELRCKEDRIEWKDIANAMEPFIKEILEKEVFHCEIIL